MLLKNPKHEMFAQIIAKGALSNRQAAIEVGYAPSSASVTGSKLIADPNVRKRINELQRRVAEQTVALVSIDKSWVIEKLRILTDKCMQDDQWAPAAAAKSLELIGKDLGMFKDYIKVEVVNSMFAKMGEVVVNLVTDQELLSRIMDKWERLAEDAAIEVTARLIEDQSQVANDEDLTK